MTQFEKYLHRYPPILCRLLARPSNGKPYTDEEIAKQGDLTVNEVRMMSELTCWDNVTIEAMKRFLAGCGIDFGNRSCTNRILSYITKSPNWKFLRMSGNWTNYYEPLCKKYKASLLKKQ